MWYGMLVAALTEADVHGMKSTHRLAREFDPVRHPKVTQSQLVQDQGAGASHVKLSTHFA